MPQELWLLALRSLALSVLKGGGQNGGGGGAAPRFIALLLYLHDTLIFEYMTVTRQPVYNTWVSLMFYTLFQLLLHYPCTPARAGIHVQRRSYVVLISPACSLFNYFLFMSGSESVHK